MLDEDFAELGVREATCLVEAIDAFGYAYHGPVVVPYDLRTIEEDDVGWHYFSSDPHVLEVLEV